MITVQDMNDNTLQSFAKQMLIGKQWYKELAISTSCGSKVDITTIEIYLKDVVDELLKREYDSGVKFAVESRFNDYQKRMLRVAYEMGIRGEPVESIEQITKINNI